MVNRNWRLPEGVDDLLPPLAWRLEQVRRDVLDVFRSWGFDYVEPPLIEYLDSLLAAGSDDMNLQTLKVVDQRTGRTLGVRPDLTSQAVRIDAHSRNVDGVQRLCYAGTVVHANPAAALDSRVPVKAGAEIFGSPELAADAEVVALMVEVLRVAGIDRPILVLGHMGIYRSLQSQLELDPQDADALFAAVQSKAVSDVEALLDDSAAARLLTRLPRLMGGREMLQRARREFAASRAGADAAAAVDRLAELADQIHTRCPQIEVRFDLAELAGYGYHNGPVFSAFHADHGRALARGGRYDGIGAAFGRPRPATGFDVSLKELLTRGQEPFDGIWVGYAGSRDGELASRRARAIAELRSAGEVVVVAVAEDEQVAARCDRELVFDGQQWQVRPLARGRGAGGAGDQAADAATDGRG